MNRLSPHRGAAGRGIRVGYLPAVLLVLLGFFPPETRGESLAGCAALVLIFAAVIWKDRLDPARATPLLVIAVVAFPLVLLSRAPGATVEPLAIVFLAGAAGLGAACVAKDERSRGGLPSILALVGAAVGAWALYQRAWGLEALVSAIESGTVVADRALVLERARGGRAFAGFPTPAALGGYLALLLPATVAAAWARRSGARWLLFALAALQTAGLLASASVTAGAALVAALAISLLRRRNRVLLAALVGLGILLAVIFTVRGREVTELTDRRSPWVLRAANFRVAGAMIVDHPWVGVGVGGFGEAYPAYRVPGDNETRHAHNLPLELGAELGLPAGILGSAFFFYLFLGVVFRRPVEAPPWWRGAEIGLAAFALHNLADFTAFLPSILWSAALLRGWISRREARSWATASNLPVLTALTATLVAATLAALGGIAWNERSATRQAAMQEQRAEALRHARRAVRLAPWSVDGRMLLAQALLTTPGDEAGRRRRIDAGRIEIERAIDLSPVRPAARDLRSRFRLALGDSPGAYADAAEAARLYPRSREYAASRDRLRDRVPSPPPAAGPVP